MASLVQDVGINHRRADVLVTQQFLDRADIIAGFKQVRGKGMAEGMTTYVLDHLRSANRFLHGTLEDTLMHVVASFLHGLGILPSVLLRGIKGVRYILLQNLPATGLTSVFTSRLLSLVQGCSFTLYPLSQSGTSTSGQNPVHIAIFCPSIHKGDCQTPNIDYYFEIFLIFLKNT